MLKLHVLIFFADTHTREEDCAGGVSCALCKILSIIQRACSAIRVLPEMAGREMKQDFIVIGAGIIGLATAQRLLQHGATVTILERGTVGQESSWAGGGILSLLCPWDYPDEVTRLALHSASLFAAWAADLHQTSGIDPEYDSSGLVVCAPFNAPLAQQWCAAHHVALFQGKSADYELPTDLPTNEQVLYLPQVAQVRNPR